jgi:serine/threonine protein kinase
MVLESLPVGTVTFLFTDIEGSTPLWDQNPRAMRESLARHNAILGKSIEAHEGRVFKVIGDAFQGVFVHPVQAIDAAIAAQHALAAEDWGETGDIRVRMGIHAGKAEVREGDYLASHTLNRVARIMSAGHGGQILLSRTVSELVKQDLSDEIDLIDLGEHYLKGISHPEHIFQVQAQGLKTDFPPLVTRHSPRGYKLLEQIGTGDFGAVYRAFQPEVNREVAIKIIQPQFANNPDFIRQFDFEAQTVARLEHPHIVPLYDYWREPDSAYLVMRWVRGGSLAKRLDDGPLDPDLASQVVDQVSAALSAAHQQGVVHRDLKPANILIDEADNAYLSDFGIARLLNGDGVDGDAGDSPAVKSQKRRLQNQSKPSADVYNFGLVLYQMLTGKAPFEYESRQAQMGDRIYQLVPSVRALCPDLPAGVDDVIRKATFEDPEQRYRDVMQLAREFQAALSGLPVPKTVDFGEGDGREIKVHNPYKGLRAFQESDADDFFGRQTLSEQLLGSLDARNGDTGENGSKGRFLAVVGPSGSGKSSVVRAGLIPALRRGALPESEKWFIVDMLPGSRPTEELELGLHRVAVAPVEGLMDQLRSDRRGLVKAAQLVLPEDEGELLLVIDQFEEVFTLAKDQDETRHFLNLLHAAVVDPHSRVRVVITLRGDFYDRPLRYPEFGKLIKEYTSVVLPLNVEELEQTMRGPAIRVGVDLEEKLVTTMIADVVEQPGALPLLQYALTELFEQREGNTLTLNTYHSIGGVLGALGRRAEAVYQDLGKAEQLVARQLFLRLVTLGEGTEDTRRRALRSELTALQRQDSDFLAERIDSVIEAYGQARLLSFDRDPVTRRPTVEVAHEALLREWPRLRKWLDDGRAEVRMQRVLANIAEDWLEAERDPSFLLRGARLDQFVSWVAETELALTQTEQDFMVASLDEHMAQLAEEDARLEHEAALERRSRNFLRDGDSRCDCRCVEHLCLQPARHRPGQRCHCTGRSTSSGYPAVDRRIGSRPARHPAGHRRTGGRRARHGGSDRRGEARRSLPPGQRQAGG